MAGTTAKLMVIAALLANAGCATVRNAFGARQGYYTQNLPDLDDRDVAKFAERQNNIWHCLVSLARAEADPYALTKGPNYSCENGKAAPNIVSSRIADATVAEVAVPRADVDALRNENRLAVPAYSEVVAAGINYVDVRCDRFMDALFWFNRMRETGSRQIQFVGAASAAALTILKASEELIGLAPLGIGLLDQTANNIGRGLLYDLPPHTVRSLVEKQQQAYLTALAKEYTTRPHAMQAVQGYAALCLPASIETEVNRAIGAAEYEPIPWENPERPAQQAAGNSTPPTGAQQAEPKDPKTNEGTPPPNHVPALKQKGD